MNPSGKAQIFALLALGAIAPAFGGVTYACASNIDTTGPSNLCATLNGTAGTTFAGGLAGIYNSTFTAASLGNISLFIQFASLPAGDLAESTQFVINSTYTNYVNALTAHEGDANDVTAVASLGGNTTNPVVNGDGVGLTSALADSLGLTADAVGITSTDASCSTPGVGSCYNGIITVLNTAGTFFYRSGTQTGSEYDFFSTVEHETDEMLGTSSCIGNTVTNPATDACTNGPPANGVSPADLFRYVGSSTTRSFIGAGGDQSNGTTTACFSINGGVSDIACYNNTDNGGDYGDWNGASLLVQNAAGTPGTSGTDITNDGGAELAVLDAVGYNLATPEPGTLGLLGVSLVALALGRNRLRRNRK
jgi:hypothetical protein